jgi:ParB family chromosome partitioning protein
MGKEKKLSVSGKLGKDVFFGVSADLPRVIEVELTNLRPNPDQPRTIFKEEALQELATSIEQHGLIQPIAVVRDPEKEGGFVIVAGERRYRAYQRLERDAIPAIITSGNPDEIALIENMQREDLSPIEEAEALAKMMNRHGYKQEDLAKVIGKSRTTVTELLSLNDLPDEIKTECRTSNLVSKGVLVQIVRIEKPQDQIRFWNKYQRAEIKPTVRAARAQRDGGNVTKSKLVPKPKKVYRTKHHVSIIVQSETIQKLSQEQIVAGLEEALEQARTVEAEIG